MLAGQWFDAQGNYYDVVKKGNRYSVTEHGALGQTGTGTATLSGNVVTLNLTNILLGRYTLQLELAGDTLRGAMQMMGIPVPIVFNRR